ncbi:EGF-like domain protein [Trichuris suis]|nr:EGF-like domain protein [Trichuris suis]
MLHNGVPYCNCDEDHYGIHCENERRTTLIPYSLIIEMDRCMSSPCSEAATCINDLKNKAYTCVCPEGYEGIDCKQEKTVCTGETCFNNGKCFPSKSPLGYRCLCSNKSTGKRCESKSFLSSRSNFCWKTL